MRWTEAVVFVPKLLTTCFCLSYYALVETIIVLLRFLITGLPEDTTWYFSESAENRHIIKKCVALKTFKPTLWAAGGYAQTLFYNAFGAPKVRYRNESVTMPDEVVLTLDWHDDCCWSADAPTILCLHGVGGSSGDGYMRKFVTHAAAAGYRCVVYNRRGHTEESLKSKLQAVRWDSASEATMQSAARSASKIGADCLWPKYADMADMQRVVDHVSSCVPHAPLFAVGFSAGANLLARYLGEAEETRFAGAVCLANCFDIVQGTMLLRKRPVTEAYMVMGLKVLFHKLQHLLHHAGLSRSDSRRILRSRSVREFDAHVSSYIFGCNDVDAYYSQQQSIDVLQNIRVPTLCLNALDDPVIHHTLPPLAGEFVKQHAPNVIIVSTKYGGHLGWMQGWKAKPWMNEGVLQFLNTVRAMRS